MPQRQKVLRVGFTSEIRHIDLVTANDTESMFVLKQALETPFDVAPGKTDVETVLFKGPLEKVSQDASAFRGTVREDIVFSDGQPLTAQGIADALAGVPWMAQRATVEASGDQVLFRLKQPDSRFDIALSHGSCSIGRRVGSQVLGTGPFQIAPLHQPHEVRLFRNPHYREAVALDEIIFRVYPADAQGRPTALLRAMEAGDVDFTTVVRRDDSAELRRVRKSFRPGGSTGILFFNTQSDRLRDAPVRQALAHAINRMNITETCYDNALAFTASSPLPRNLGSANDDLHFNLRKSAAILEDHQLKLPSRLRLLVIWGPRTYLPQPTAVASEIQRQLRPLGVQVELVMTTSSSEFFQAAIDGDFDAVLAGWSADTLDSCDFLESILLSDRVPTWKNLSVSANHSRYQNPAMDQALARYRAERNLGDLEEIIRLLSEDAPLLPLMYGSMATLMSYRIKNFQPCSLPVFSLANLDLTGG